jgi:hypothetical protein
MSGRNEMEECYKDTTIVITARVVEQKLKWKSDCKIKFRKGARLGIRHLRLDLDYNTVQQAERAGMVFSKKWVDAGMPNPLSFDRSAH